MCLIKWLNGCQTYTKMDIFSCNFIYDFGMDMVHTQVLMKWAMHAIFQSNDLEQANFKAAYTYSLLFFSTWQASYPVLVNHTVLM